MLDDAQLRTLEERLRYLRELEERRAAILESVRAQGKLDDALEAQITGRRHQGAAGGHLPAVQAQAAHQGADRPRGRPGAAGRRAARATRRSTRTPRPPPFVDADKGVADAAAALEGARAILVERFAEDADLIGELRERMWARGPARRQGARGQGGGGREVRRLLRLRRAVHRAALAPHPRDVPRREGGGPRPHPGAGGARRPSGGPSSYERIDRPTASGSPTAAAPATSGWPTPCAGPGAPASWCTSASTCGCGCARPPRTRRSGSSRRTCATCCSPRPAGTRATMGLDPGFRTGREGRRRRRDRQGRRDGRRSTRTCPRNKWDESLAKLAAARQGARRRADRDRQRHGVPRDRQARRRTDRQAPGAEAHQGDGLRGGRVGVLGVGLRLAGAARHGRVAARRRLHRPASAGPAGRAGEDRPEVDRRRPVPARPVRGEAVALARRGGRGLRERRRRRRQHRVRAAAGAGSPASARASPRTSWRTATPTARSGPARRSRTWRGWARRRTSSARASCASAAATTRWTPPACTPRRTRWCGGW